MKEDEVMCGNNDMMEESSRREFLTCDQEMLIRKYALDADREFLYIRFLNTAYQVDRKTGFIYLKGTAQEAPHMPKMAIYDLFNYHKEETACPALSGSWKSTSDLGGLIGAQHAKRIHNEAILRPFVGQCEQLRGACEAMGGQKKKGGDVSYLLPVFDFFPVWFQFWDADDEFPADLRILWDGNAESFLHYEIVFYVTLYIEEALTAYLCDR